MRLFLWVAAALAFAPAVAFACSSCACGDPVASAIGIPDAQPGRGFIGIGTEAGRRRAGFDTHTDLEIALTGGWTGERTRLFARVPWVRRRVTQPGPHGPRTSEAQGLGDLETTGMLVLSRSGNLAQGQSVHALATVTLETGRRLAGESEDLQPGIGAPSVALGAGWFGHRRADRLYFSALARRTLPTPTGYQIGDAWLANAGWQRGFGLRTDLTLELNARHAQADQWRGGFEVPDSGGTLLHVTPGVLVAVPGNLSVRAAVQVPVAGRLSGDQEAGPVAQVSLYRSF